MVGSIFLCLICHVSSFSIPHERRSRSLAITTVIDAARTTTITKQKIIDTSDDDNDSYDSDDEVASSASTWATYAVLFSSLSDGIIPNDGARSFLRYSLANTLLSEVVQQKEDVLKQSAEFSPCNGPNIDTLDKLESIDQILDQGRQLSFEHDLNAVNKWSYKAMAEYNMENEDSINIRLLYIPTAMYALNPNSSNSPGKQLQRKRADGKKRRTQLLKLINDIVSDTFKYNDCDSDRVCINLLATTLDLADGSIKQSEVIGSNNNTDKGIFPANDKEALSTWNPHIIYIEGGNTFWLQSCIEKGQYSSLIKNACIGKNGSIFMGKSAGAIVAGSTIATATWKGWDDPSVVEGRETYNDWLDCKGFEFSGNCISYFPHMSDDWTDLIEEKVKEQGLDKESLFCLREEDACCVIGSKKLAFLASAG